MSRRRQTIARRLLEAQHSAALLTTFPWPVWTPAMGQAWPVGMVLPEPDRRRPRRADDPALGDRRAHRAESREVVRAVVHRVVRHVHDVVARGKLWEEKNGTTWFDTTRASAKPDDLATLVYTSGTTGNPKGVLYEHRSTVIHAMAEVQPNVLGVCARSVAMPIVPMFHAAAWGLPFAAPIAGCKLVCTADYAPKAICDLMHEEGVTHTAAVPTVWLGLMHYVDETGSDLGDLKAVTIGGSAAPRAMVEFFEKRGVAVFGPSRRVADRPGCQVGPASGNVWRLAVGAPATVPERRPICERTIPGVRRHPDRRKAVQGEGRRPHRRRSRRRLRWRARRRPCRRIHSVAVNLGNLRRLLYRQGLRQALPILTWVRNTGVK